MLSAFFTSMHCTTARKSLLTVLCCLPLAAALAQAQVAAEPATGAAAGEAAAQRPAIAPAIAAQISRFMRSPLTNPPRSVWQTQYKGRTVFLLPAEGNDGPAVVVDTRGKVLCEPFNGIAGLTGQGDERCPDFAASHTKPRLLWKDSRHQANSIAPTAP